MATKPTEQAGKAYGFFKCNATKAQIEAELPTVRKLAQVPSELELKLIEDVKTLKGDAKLMELAQQAKAAQNNYVFEATYAGATNKATADEVAMVLNQAYQSPLYKEGEQFSGGIIFEENGEYVFRE